MSWRGAASLPLEDRVRESQLEGGCGRDSLAGGLLPPSLEHPVPMRMQRAELERREGSDAFPGSPSFFLIFYFYFLAAPFGMWDLSSPTRH